MPALSPRYTIEMLDAMPQEPGARYELVDGLLIVTPAPGRSHAKLVRRIMVSLAAAIPESIAEIAPPGEIRFGRSNSLQPDVLVYPTPSSPQATWKDLTRWWLAVEVVSPSSRDYDREEKRVAYLERGVPLYWVVDAETRTVDVWHADDRTPRVVTERLTWTTPSGHRVEIELKELFRDIPTEA